MQVDAYCLQNKVRGFRECCCYPLQTVNRQASSRLHQLMVISPKMLEIQSPCVTFKSNSTCTRVRLYPGVIHGVRYTNKQLPSYVLTLMPCR